MRPALSLPLLLVTAACGAVPGTETYSCGGLPIGVSCISARDTYKLTDHGKPVVAVAGKETAFDQPPATDGTVPAPATPTPPAAAGTQLAALGLPEPGQVASIALRPELAGAPDVIPLRTPSRVLRIWIAPWEDDAGRLHVPGYTYAEIEPRRWSIGQDEPEQRMHLQPLPPPGTIEPLRPGPQPSDPPLVPQEVNGTGPTPPGHRNPPPLPRSARNATSQEVRFYSAAPSR